MLDNVEDASIWSEIAADKKSLENSSCSTGSKGSELLDSDISILCKKSASYKLAGFQNSKLIKTQISKLSKLKIDQQKSKNFWFHFWFLATPLRLGLDCPISPTSGSPDDFITKNLSILISLCDRLLKPWLLLSNPLGFALAPVVLSSLLPVNPCFRKKYKN